jgi:transposase-like protein
MSRILLTMDALIHTRNTFSDYPKNVHRQQVSSHGLRSYHERLRYQSKRLFDEQKSAVDFVDRRDGE